MKQRIVTSHSGSAVEPRLGMVLLHCSAVKKIPMCIPAMQMRLNVHYYLGNGAKCSSGGMHLLTNRSRQQQNRSLLEHNHRPAVFKTTLISTLTFLQADRMESFITTGSKTPQQLLIALVRCLHSTDRHPGSLLEPGIVTKLALSGRLGRRVCLWAEERPVRPTSAT